MARPRIPDAADTGPATATTAAGAAATAVARRPARADESGGPAWPEPTRYGDWERGGRVSDF